MEEGSVALLPELLVLLALRPPHALHHLFAQLHGRRQRLGVSTQDVAKVYVEELPWKSESEDKLDLKKRKRKKDPEPGIVASQTNFPLTSFCQQQVVQVSVSNSQDICDDAVTSWRSRGTFVQYAAEFSWLFV